MPDAEPAVTPSTNGMMIGTPQHFGWLNQIVRVVILLNLIDAVFTLTWVWLGLATEANILLENLVKDFPVIFVAVKVSLVSLGTLLLWIRRDKPLAVIGIFACFLAYYWVVLYHLHYLRSVIDALSAAA